jgi:hypothetical protein
MVGYQRAAAEDDVEIPPHIIEHISSCAVCGEEWERVKVLERQLRTHIRRQAKAVIRRIKVIEEWERPAMATSLTPGERSEYVGLLREDLQGEISPTGGHPEQVPDVDQLGWREIVSACDDVRMIENDQERYERTLAHYKAFKARTGRERERGLIDLGTMGRILKAELLIAGPATSADQPGSFILPIVQPERMAAIASFVASIPAVSFLQITPHLLECRGDELIFRSGECGRRQPEMEAAAARFTPAAPSWR